MSRAVLEEGWYLMSTSELERELARLRSEDDPGPSGAVRLSVPDALAYRSAGNVPDENGRSLRLVLHISSREDLTYLQSKRLLYEPDFHDPPTWRRDGSKPVNVVPVRTGELEQSEVAPWYEQPDLAELEAEWRAGGTVAGLRVDGGYRGFVFKTVLALRAAGREVTVDSVAGSIRRWLPDDEADRVHESLRRANARRSE